TAIGAAFVDFGQGKNGFLHTSDVLSAYGEDDWSLDKLLSTSVDPGEWDVDGEKPDRDEAHSAGHDEGHAEAGTGAAEEAHVEEKKPKESGGRKGRPERTQRFRTRPRLPITDLLKKGEMVVVQVTKDAIGDKDRKS